jgi:hypothetical protein
MVECKKRSNWNKWKEAIEAEFNSLKKRKVFTEVMLEYNTYKCIIGTTLRISYDI